jgi:hypothetical protein
MSKHLQSLSIMFLGLCIVVSSWFISQSLKSNQVKSDNTQNQHSETQDRYEFITIASDYFIIFDKQTGEYWSQVGGSEWKVQKSIPTLAN